MDGADARRRREEAATRYRPAEIDLLLVAEGPPSALDRYFYFDNVTEQDSLFRYVARGVLNDEPTRSNKAALLGKLRDRGVFLIDLSPNPVGRASLESLAADLVIRCQELDPRAIIVIKATVFDAAYWPLKRARLPVVNERVPFPGSGQQRRFVESFGRALELASSFVRPSAST